MKRTTPQNVINEYIRVGAFLKEVYSSDDSGKGNREAAKLRKLFKKLEKDPELAENSLPLMFSHENAVVRIKAAAACISLNIHIQEAKKVLEEVADNIVLKEDADIGEKLIAFDAEMTLKMWQKRGYLKVYPDQEIRYAEFPQD